MAATYQDFKNFDPVAWCENNGINPELPTPWKPSTEEKVNIMAARRELGLPVFFSLDADGSGKGANPTNGAARREGNDVLCREILKLLKRNPDGLTVVEIMSALDVTKGIASYRLQKLAADQLVCQYGKGSFGRIVWGLKSHE